MMMIFSREEKTSIVPTLFLDRWWTQSSRRRRRNSSHKKSLLTSIMCFCFIFSLFVRCNTLYCIFLGAHTAIIHERNEQKPIAIEFLSSIENIYFDNMIWEREREKNTFSLFTLEFVENEARRNKMVVFVWVGNAIVAHGWHLLFRVHVHVSLRIASSAPKRKLN